MAMKFKKEVVKVEVKDNEIRICDLTFMVTDSQAVQIKEFVENLISGKKNVSAPAEKIIAENKTTKVGDMVVEEEKSPKSRFDELEAEFENHGKKQLHFWDSALVIINEEDKKYRARFNYRFIYAISKDKETGKHSDRKNEFMKEMFKKQIKEFGAKWVEGPSEYDFGWYEFPTKKSAEEYRKARKADDKKYEKK